MITENKSLSTKSSGFSLLVDSVRFHIQLEQIALTQYGDVTLAINDLQIVRNN